MWPFARNFGIEGHAISDNKQLNFSQDVEPTVDECPWNFVVEESNTGCFKMPPWEENLAASEASDKLFDPISVHGYPSKTICAEQRRNDVKSESSTELSPI